MPSSSPELRAKWGGEQGVGDEKATKFLEERDWSQINTGLWRCPAKGGTEEEWEAIQFLQEEWDHEVEHTSFTTS